MSAIKLISASEAQKITQDKQRILSEGWTQNDIAEIALKIDAVLKDKKTVERKVFHSVQEHTDKDVLAKFFTDNGYKVQIHSLSLNEFGSVTVSW